MGTWSTNTVLPNSLGYIAQGSCVYNGKIYMAGGFGDGVVDTVYEYDPVNDDYTTLSSLGTARYAAAIGIYGSTIYIAGGFNGASLNTVEKYDISSPSAGWSYVANIPAADFGSVGVIYGDYFYTFGGYANDVYKYDIVGNSWSAVDNTSDIGRGPAVEVVGDYIWVIGGSFDNNVVRKWDPSTDSWVTGSYTNSTANAAEGYYAASCVQGTKIYMAGGYGSIVEFRSYDTSTDTWDDTLPDMITGRVGVIGDVVDDNFYVIGGRDVSSYSNKNESYDLPSSASTNPGGDINWCHTRLRG